MNSGVTLKMSRVSMSRSPKACAHKEVIADRSRSTLSLGNLPAGCIVFLILATTTLLASYKNAQAADSIYTSEIFPAAIKNVFQAGYVQLSQSSLQLLESARAGCHDSNLKTLSQMQDEFRSVVSAFARVEMYRLGPMVEELRQNRLFYWPDKRRVGERQLRKLLKDPTSKELTESRLAGKSVALQGLPALERLLFGKSAVVNITNNTAADCHVVTVIAENIHSMANSIESGWNDKSDLVISMRNPTADSDVFRTEQEVLTRLVTQIVIGVDTVLNRKIRPLVGTSANIRAAPLWLSQQTMPMIKGNLEGIRALLIDSGLAADTNLEDELQFEFRSANTMLERLLLLPDLTDASGKLTDDANSLTKALAAVVTGIHVTLDDRFLSALGISTGFNSEDGD